MRYCKNCLFPDTKPDLYFDGEEFVMPVVQLKQSGMQKRCDWEERGKEFDNILKTLPKNNMYDCVVPVSGGKDSTYQTHRLVKEHGLKALAVTFDQFDQTPTGEHNLGF